MKEVRDIKYINRDFNDFKNSLVEFAKNYFPDTYNDFSPASPGMMFIEMAAYVGDVLSFYSDTQLQETFVQHAKNPENLYSLAYTLGYKPKITTVAEVELEVTQNVAATGADYQPNFNQALLLSANAQLKATTTGQPSFLIDQSIDFSFSSSYDPTTITVASIAGGNPAEYTLKKKVKAFSGEVAVKTEVIGNAEKFKTITVEDTDIVGILSIVDSSGKTWTEVPYLGQETVYDDLANTDLDSGEVANKLTLKKVPRRFVARFNSLGNLQIQFGAGVSDSDDSVIIPNPTNVGIGNADGLSRIDTSYDPSNFLFSRTYGVAPSNITLTISYLKGGGVQANVPANTITQQSAVTATASDNSYQETIAFTNILPATGGKDGDTIEEIRENSLRSFNEQGRAVTLQDYNVRAQSLPAKFGSVAKTFVTKDEATSKETKTTLVDDNPFSLSLYTLAYDNNKKLTYASDNLKRNLKTYLSQYMMISDSINIKDAFVVNIGINFEVLALPNYTGRAVLLECIQKVKEYFITANRNINQPINLARITTVLDRVKGVQTVQKLEIVNKVGETYSEFGYDIAGATRNNVVYPSYDPCFFEIKYPDTDIKGRIITV
jgi:hypothetical protein|tara:strand:- start:481 stop:2298 length:1818 start_codon:yes stop_codon:yes gene_type:complete